MKILLVDDSEAILYVLSDKLKDHTVKTRTSGAGIQSVVKEFNPDICIVDLVLENESGIDIIKSIIKCNRKSNVIMLTSNSSEEVKNKAINAGAQMVIKKDYDLSRSIKRIINRIALIK